MKLVKLTLMAIVIAFATTSCSKQIDTPAAYPPPSEEMNAGVVPEAATVTAAATAPATTATLSMVQTPVYTSVNAYIGGFLQALPGDYNETSTKHPLIIFLHGVGEIGNGTSDLSKVAINSVPNLIKNNKFPATYTVKGKTFSFIVLSPQFKVKPKAEYVNDMVNYAIAHYRVDTSRIYIVGLSMGGGVVWNYGGLYTSRAAAIVPMCGASSFNLTQGKNMAAANLPVWAFHNNGDPTVALRYTDTWVDCIKKNMPLLAPRKTIFSATAHNCWTKASDPNYKENMNGVNMNIYEWLLLYTKK